jgi:hypothetical protein
MVFSGFSPRASEPDFLRCKRWGCRRSCCSTRTSLFFNLVQTKRSSDKGVSGRVIRGYPGRVIRGYRGCGGRVFHRPEYRSRVDSGRTKDTKLLNKCARLPARSQARDTATWQLPLHGKVPGASAWHYGKSRKNRKGSVTVYPYNVTLVC